MIKISIKVTSVKTTLKIAANISFIYKQTANISFIYFSRKKSPFQSVYKTAIKHSVCESL